MNKKILEQLRNNDPKLKTLNLCNKKIEISQILEIAKALQDNDSLKEIGLGLNQIGAAGAKALAEALRTNSTLTGIDLERNQIGDADYHLGNCYYLGEEVEEDYEEAVKWYTKAAEQGHAAAQLMTGYLYYYGHGVAKDYEEAVKWWTAAAEQGDVRSQVMLAICYYLGRGVKLDYQEARHWYRIAGVQDSDLAAQCCREELETIINQPKQQEVLDSERSINHF